MNKNGVIFVLAVMVVMGSIWGSVSNKKKILLGDELIVKEQEIQAVRKQNNQVQEQVLAKTADLQQVLQEKENQLLQARDELVRLRRNNKELEAKLSVRSSAITKLTQERSTLVSQLQEKTVAPKQVESASSDNKLAACQEQLKIAEKNNAKLKAWLETKNQRLASLQERPQQSGEQEKYAAEIKNLQDALEASKLENEKTKQRLATVDADMQRKQTKIERELESARAQVIGLEKIIEEKNNSIEDTGKELDRFKINMDVLLTKIADQQDSFQELQSETKELVKELSSKNAEIANLNDKLLQSPVK
jgi:chromosome segregation ATPase